MKITVCIGSSCHIKGARQIVEQFQQLIEENELDDLIELGGTLCTGNCRRGVCVTVDGELHSVSPENAAEFFSKTVKEKLQV